MAKDFTIFVDGLPSNMNSNRLQNIFKLMGEIVDVYISFKKRSVTSCIFGFVRVRNEEDALEAISTFDSKVINGNRLKVKWAKNRKVCNSIQSSNKSPSQMNDSIIGLLNACLEEKFNSFKKELLNQAQESLFSTLEPLMEKISRDFRSTIANASKDKSAIFETVVVEHSFSSGGEANNPCNLKELPNGGSNVVKNKVVEEIQGDVGGNLSSESVSSAESNLSDELELRNPPIISYYRTQSSAKNKKKKKRKSKRKHTLNFMDNYFDLDEEWWSDQVFSLSEEEDLIQGEISNLIGSNDYSNVEVKEDSTSEHDEIEKINDPERCNKMCLTCSVEHEVVSPNKEQIFCPPKLNNKIFPSSKRPTNPSSLLILRPRFLKFALGVCKVSRKKFSRKSTVKYVIDEPPNSRVPLVLKPI